MTQSSITRDSERFCCRRVFGCTNRNRGSEPSSPVEDADSLFNLLTDLSIGGRQRWPVLDSAIDPPQKSLSSQNTDSQPRMRRSDQRSCNNQRKRCALRRQRLEVLQRRQQKARRSSLEKHSGRECAKAWSLLWRLVAPLVTFVAQKDAFLVLLVALRAFHGFIMAVVRIGL